MHSGLINTILKSCFILVLIAFNYSIAYSQDTQIEKKINLAFESAENKNYKEANNYLIELSNFAVSYRNKGDYKHFLEIYQKIIEIGRITYGEYDTNLLILLGNLAVAYSENGNHQKALQINQEVVSKSKKVLGENHPDYLMRLNNLAFDYSNIGNYQKAYEINLKVIELAKDVVGEKNPDYLVFQSNLASTYSDIGDYQKALEIYKKVTESRKELLGEKNPDYLTSLNNLAVAYSDIGDFSKALEINLNVCSLRKEVLGEKHPDYFGSINNLAVSFIDIGDYQKAFQTLVSIIETEKEVLGEKHPDYLTSLSNLSVIYSDLGENQKALDIDLKANKILKEVLGEKHPEYINGLNNTAFKYSEIGDHNKELEINLKSVELTKEIFGENHPEYIISLTHLGATYLTLHEIQEAYKILVECVEIGRKVWGEFHPNYLTSLGYLAASEFSLSKNDSASSHYIKYLNSESEKVIRYLGIMTEHQREMFWNKFSSDFMVLPKFLEKTLLFNHKEACVAYDIALFTKGLLLNTTRDFEQIIKGKGTPEAIAKFDELKILKLQIQRLQEKPIAERYMNIDSLENIAQQKETELVKLSKEYGDYTRALKINWKDVQDNLQEKDVAVEFVEYPTQTDTIKYAALVLRKGWQYPQMIPLFRKDQIDEFIKQDINKIYSNGYVGEQIMNLVWEPLEKVINPGDRVYFSPAGILYQLAIENIPASDLKSLGDVYQMYRLSSTKELVINSPESESKTTVLYGGLNYNVGVNAMLAESKKYPVAEDLLAVRGYSKDTTNRKGWGYLPGTLKEIDQIDLLMKAKDYQVAKYTGDMGNEESFKALSGKKIGIIHIATHGFFLPIEESRKNPFMQMRMEGQNETGGVDPMLRSGLMLSGGNRAWQGEEIPDNIEDGVLTAREISRMDLRGTDLVVLSACETGLGEISSEGVFGLQRSFKQAGVKNLIMSLWEVNDQATSFMMKEFYSDLLSGKEMRTAFLHAKQKTKENFPEPQYWAAFILMN